MKYILGLDGGGSKTRCVLATLQGKVIADVVSGPTNYHNIGILETQKTLHDLFHQVLIKGNIDPEEIAFAFFGMAGADMPSDYAVLNKMIEEEFKDIPYEVANDSWLIMRSGTKDPYGAVSIYGTGANAAAINKAGEMHILRALGYDMGGAGGGMDISSNALHYAFRSNELTYKKSALETEVPSILGKRDLNELLLAMHPEYKLSPKALNKLPPLVFKLAKTGDEVCQEILTRCGQTQGQMLIGVLRQSGIDGPFPVVLGGSIYKGESPEFINAFQTTVRKAYPHVTFRKSHLAPVMGALLFAMDRIKKEIDDEFIENLSKNLSL